jgi:SSS family solute:Na+ symporter
MIVQRTLAAENMEEARSASIFAGYLKILPVFILVLPGLAGRILFPQVIPDKMYATMVNELLPSGAKGIVIAALLAALMSSLSSIFNSSSTLVVMDFYKKWRPGADERELVRAGQISTLALVLIALAWLPFIGLMSGQIYVYLQSVQAYISPPIAAVFLAGLLWRRANGAGAIAALSAGFVLGSLRFIAEIGMKAKWMSWGPLVGYASINFLHFAIFLFIFSIVLLVLFGYLAPGPSRENLAVLAPSQAPVSSGTASANRRNLISSAILVMIVLVFWLIFSPIFMK